MQLVRECHQQCQGPEVIELNPPGRLLGSRSAGPGLHHNNCFSLLTLSVESFPARASLFKHTQSRLCPPCNQQPAKNEKFDKAWLLKYAKYINLSAFRNPLRAWLGVCDPAGASVRVAVTSRVFGVRVVIKHRGLNRSFSQETHSGAAAVSLCQELPQFASMAPEFICLLLRALDTSGISFNRVLCGFAAVTPGDLLGVRREVLAES